MNNTIYLLTIFSLFNIDFYKILKLICKILKFLSNTSRLIELQLHSFCNSYSSKSLFIEWLNE